MFRVVLGFIFGCHWPVFAAAALAIGTFLSFTQYDGFTPRGGNLLANGDFSGDLDHWRWRGPSDTAHVSVHRNAEEAPAYVEIRNRDPARSAHLWQIVAEPTRFSYVSVAFELLLEDMIPGRRTEHQARIVLASYDSTGKGLWHHPHVVVVEDGSHGWKQYRGTFRVGRDVHELILIAQLIRSTGSIRMRGVTLRGAEARAEWIALQAVLIALWALLGVALARNILRAGPGRAAGIIAMAVATVFLLGAPGPKQMQLAAENEIVALFSSSQTPPDEAAPPEMQAGQPAKSADTAKQPAQPPEFELLRPGKFAHLLLFALLGAALVLRRPSAPAGLLLASLLLAAMCGEVLQFFAHGRTPALQDFAINAVGAFVGTSIILGRRILRRLIRPLK
jgi:VanZ family protein